MTLKIQKELYELFVSGALTMTQNNMIRTVV